MSQLKSVVVVAMSVLLSLSLSLGAFDERPTSGGRLSGVQEFFTSGTFTVPKEVTHVVLTMWGAGGGGGAGQSCGSQCLMNGGAGGGGAYTNTVVPVIPGTTYTVTVGQGGTGGVNAGDNGTDGGDSQLALGNTVLAFAGGGKGGGGATASSAGTGGAAGQADSTAQISHSPLSVPNICASISPGPYFYGNPGYATNLAPDLKTDGGSPFAVGGFSGGCGGGIGAPGGTSGYVLLTF